MTTRLKYPIGIQSFEDLRRRGCVYVDKTDLVYRLVTEGKYYFLSRPRRFGKSLLLSTLEAYFQGKKELFDGLAISALETEWTEYPVLHFDFSAAEGYERNHLSNYIQTKLSKYAQEYGVNLESQDLGVGPRFGFLIEAIYKAKGQNVVVLIDEYDKGIIDVIENKDILEANQQILCPFFSQLKAQDKYIHFAFITGVSRFRHYTIFSGFNNPNDVSLDRRYSSICGITETELIDNFYTGLSELSETYGMSIQEVVSLLRQKYDGYRFTREEQLVYNPFSLINCLDKKEFDNYWISTGTSKVLVNYLMSSDIQLTAIENLWATKETIESVYDVAHPISLLFQTGYLTIKEAKGASLRLGIPNGEVRYALVEDLIPRTMGQSEHNFPIRLETLLQQISTGDVDGFMTELQEMVAKVPYQQFDYDNVEKTYHLIIYQIFLMLGIETRSEISMSGSRIDMVAQTDRFVYVMEFKLGGTTSEALAQIDDRGYALPWAADGRQVYKIGAVFSPDTRTLSSWAYTHDTR